MVRYRSILASLAFTSTVAGAQALPLEDVPPRIDIATLLNLDDDRAEQVHAIMRAAREKMRAAREQIGRPTDESTRMVMHAAMHAIRVDTDQRLAAVLSASELQQLREALPPPPLRLRPGS